MTDYLSELLNRITDPLFVFVAACLAIADSSSAVSFADPCLSTKSGAFFLRGFHVFGDLNYLVKNRLGYSDLVAISFGRLSVILV